MTKTHMTEATQNIEPTAAAEGGPRITEAQQNLQHAGPARGSSLRRRVSWIAALGAIAVLLSFGSLGDVGPAGDAERALAIARSLRCPQCAGESLAESNVSIAREMRAEIARRVDEGQSSETIRAAFAARYGQAILLTPPASGTGSLVWIVPTVVGLVAAAGLGLAFYKWQKL